MRARRKGDLRTEHSIVGRHGGWKLYWTSLIVGLVVDFHKMKWSVLRKLHTHILMFIS